MKKLNMILPLALILCFMVGCQDKEAMAELETFKAQAAVEEQNKAVVLQWFEELGKGNVDQAFELCAPDYVLNYPSNTAIPWTREQNQEFSSMMHIAFPDVSFSIEELIAVGDKVISRFITRGTHNGEFMGIPATGNKVESSGIMISQIADGKIVEQWEDFDMLGMMRQLGMELKPKEGEK